MRATKAVIGGVSTVLVLGIVIGVIIGVGDKNYKHPNSNTLAAASKSVYAVCSQTDFKQQCLDSVTPVADNRTATLSDYLRSAVNHTIVTLSNALNSTGNLTVDPTVPTQKMAVDDCNELLRFAVDELDASFSSMGDLNVVQDKQDELMSWLSAVISYQQTCLDGLETPQLQHQMGSFGLANATQLTSNALAIVSAISDVMKAFNLTSNTGVSFRRRLLEAPIEEYPVWLSSGERKLLGNSVAPNAIVAKDGSGRYGTIQDAIDAYPKNHVGRYVVYVKAGIYKEYVTITKNQPNVLIYGDGPRKTMVTGNRSYKDRVTTYRTATFAVMGDGFIAKSMGFQNTAGAIGHQAVALRVQADRAVVYNCRIDGYQDTLYQQAHRQFYRNCVISGTVDFIFGDAAAVIQNSLIVVRMPMKGQKNTVTAHGRSDKRESTGLVIQNCRILPEEKLFPVIKEFPSYLGRPWKNYSRTVVMESTIGGFIDPAGWLPWDGSNFLNTLYYAEYANRGPGAKTDKRVKWAGYHVITDQKVANSFTVNPFIQGSQWLPISGAPFFLGLKNAL